MATVRFSDALKSQILNIASKKFVDKIEVAKNSEPTGWGDYIHAQTLGSYLLDMQKLPVQFFKMRDKIVVCKVNGLRCNFTFMLNRPMPFPVAFPPESGAQYNGSYGDEIVLQHRTMWDDYHAQLVAYNERIKAAEARRDEFVSAVRTVITTYSTLAPALKAWPPLWDLIPENVKDTHRLIVSREKVAPVLTIDLDRITAMAAANKMGF